MITRDQPRSTKINQTNQDQPKSTKINIDQQKPIYQDKPRFTKVYKIKIEADTKYSQV